MTLTGKAGPQHEKRVLYARLVAKGTPRLPSGNHRQSSSPEEQIDQFFQSFKLY